MAIIVVNKISTTQVAGGIGSKYGFVISTHSETDEFSFDDQVNIDTSTLSEADALIVTNFIALVEAQLLV